MRKFIVSDLHGNGEVYDSIMAYLENISIMDEVELFINGDLIDRGFDGYRMLVDVMERTQGKGNISIHYLAGNHELMMYQALKERIPGAGINPWCDWMRNGGWVIEGELDLLQDGEKKCEELKNYLSSLKIYQCFEEKINGNPLLLVHAQAPSYIKNICDVTIGDDDFFVDQAVWTRREERGFGIFSPGPIIGYNRIGLDGYLTIIGHTPVKQFPGFLYQKEENFINIDGGCAPYAMGLFECDHVPLVEIEKDKLSILIFNHNNEIVDGYFFDRDISHMDSIELEKRKVFLNPIYNGNGEKNKQLILDYVREHFDSE